MNPIVYYQDFEISSDGQIVGKGPGVVDVVKFQAFIWKTSWWELSLGGHICLKPHFNIEIHLPFCFLKIGWSDTLIDASDLHPKKPRLRKDVNGEHCGYGWF